ncbi:MAG: hypothetical protein PHF29_01790 [Candidatus Riflebacteria bacterium]|nr:hypothetical protein [Candidatus Riflebacteria bacterium]
MKRLLCIILLLAACTQLNAQIPDKNINFYTGNIEFIFQPPLQKSFNAQHPLNKEVPQINLTLILFDNYVEYLKKISKISQKTRLTILYSPDLAIDEYDDNLKLIKIHELGYNHILKKINDYLKLHKETDEKFLLDTAESLFTIAGKMECKVSDLANNLRLRNISADEKCLEPDSNFCLIAKNKIAVIKPAIQNNKIFVLTETDNGYYSELLLDRTNGYYENIIVSHNGEFLAYTVDMAPSVINLSTKKANRIINSNSNKIFLNMQWAPNKNILAGVVLDKKTQERNIFIYDADKNENIEIKNKNEILPENQLFAFPYWSPNSDKIIFASAKSAHLIDLKNNLSISNLIMLNGSFSELMWAQNGDSFAITETVGQTRSRTEFDDLDFRKTLIRRFRITEKYEATEDYAQKVESRNTLKLVEFSHNDRILYLEGRLTNKRLDKPTMDLSKHFKAYLSPFPASSVKREDITKEIIDEPTELPIKYLYVFRNMNGKQTHVFDAGYNHTNHLYIDKQTNWWFIGLRNTTPFDNSKNLYNQRTYPYPFSENNNFLFSSLEKDRIEKFINFIENYNIRSFEFSENASIITMLANFNGPLNVWSGKVIELIAGLTKDKNAFIKHNE